MHANRKVSERSTAPLSEMRALALDFGRQYDLMDQCERGAIDARQNPTRTANSIAIEDRCEKQHDLAFRRAMAIIDLLATCQPSDRKDLVIFAAAFKEKFEDFINEISDLLDDKEERERDQLRAMIKTLLHGIELNSGVEAKALGIKAMWPQLDSQKESADA